MADREEAEIHLKITSDTSGAKEVTDALKETARSEKEERERVRAEHQKGLWQQTKAERDAAMEGRAYSVIRTGKQVGLTEWEKGAAQSFEQHRRFGKTWEQELKNQETEKSKIEDEYQKNRLADLKKSQAEEGRISKLHEEQQAALEKAFDLAKREGRVTKEGPQGPGGPPTPPGLVGPGGPAGGGGIFDKNTTSAVRFGAALFGLGVGLSVYSFAGRLLHTALTDIVKVEQDAFQATKNLNATYGETAKQYSDLITTVSRGGGGGVVGFKVSDVQNAVEGISAYIDNLRLSKQQTDQLIQSAARLASYRNIPLKDATEALTQALMGSHQAADALGLSLSDVMVSQQAANGQFAASFGSLTDSEKAGLRLIVVVDQTTTSLGNTVKQVNPLQVSSTNLARSWEDLNTQFGSPALETAAGILEGVRLTLNGIKWVIDNTNWSKLGPPIANEPISEADIERLNKNAAARRQAIGDAIQAALYGPKPGFMGHLPITLDTSPTLTAAQEKAKAAATPSRAAQTLRADRLQDIKETQNLLGLHAQATTAAATPEKTLFAQMKEDAPAIRRVMGEITSSVQNISALSPAQRGALAIRQAEIGALQKQNLAEVAATHSAYEESAAVRSLKGAYEDLVGAQAEVNRLQLEQIQLQGQLAQAQLDALNVNRAVQDNDLRMTRDRLVAQDRLLSPQQRAAARRDIRQAAITGVDLQLKAFDANLPTIRAQRAVEVSTLLGRIATATEGQAQQKVDFAITGGISVTVSGDSVTIPQDQIDKIAGQVQEKVADGLAHSAQVNTNKPSNTLALMRGRPY